MNIGRGTGEPGSGEGGRGGGFLRFTLPCFGILSGNSKEFFVDFEGNIRWLLPRAACQACHCA